MANKKTEWLVAPLIVTLFISSFFTPQGHAQVTLTVGEGSGLPGSLENPVTVSLNNPNDGARAVQVDVCDVDNYLSCTACETTERTTSFECETNELEGGCCRVILVPFGANVVEEGEGPIFIIRYDVSGEAPEGECKDLNPVDAKIAGENLESLDVTLEAGEFCFLTSSSTTTTTKKCACAVNELYSRNSEEVKVLRNFRDQVLRKTQSGRELIRLYYQVSPAIMKAIKEDKGLREKVKETIDKALPLIKGEEE